VPVWIADAPNVALQGTLNRQPHVFTFHCRTHGVRLCDVAAPAGLFASWQSCLETKPSAQQQQQQHLRWGFIEHVAYLWHSVFASCERIVPVRLSKVAPVLLRSVVPALQFAGECMQHIALASGSVNGSSSSLLGSPVSSSSSSSNANSHHEVSMPALLLQQAALNTLVIIRDKVGTSSNIDLQMELTRGMAMQLALEDAVERAAVLQLGSACCLLHRLVKGFARSSSCGGIGSSTTTTSSSSSSNAALPNMRRKPLQQHYVAADMLALDESLLQLLPGGQAYVDALAMAALYAEESGDLQAARTAGAVPSIGVSSAAARHVAGWTSVAADLLCSKCVVNLKQRSTMLAADASSSSGQQLGAAPVPHASPVYLQLFVQLPLLSAALLQQQQQQQQQGVAPVGIQGSFWLDSLRHHSTLLRRYIRAVTRLGLPDNVLDINQLLSGPDAPLLRALAAPLHVAEFWQCDDGQLLAAVGGPGEQLYARKACLDAAAGRSESGGSYGVCVSAQGASCPVMPPTMSAAGWEHVG
jgi:hypothetical protein